MNHVYTATDTNVPGPHNASRKVAATFRRPHHLKDPSQADGDEMRVFECSFSSEVAVDRVFGNEVLSHEPGAVRLGWLGSGDAPVLVDHDERDHVGVIEAAVIGDDRVGRIRVRLGRSARAEEIRRDIADGIRKNISVGYRIHKMVEVDGSGNGGPVYRAVDWEPLEVSIVSVPADPTVGIRSGPGNERIHSIVGDDPPASIMKENSMETVYETRSAAHGALPTHLADKANNDKRHAEISEISAIGKEFNCSDMARWAIVNGVPLDDFRKNVIDLFGERQNNVQSSPAALGFNGREQRQYSLLRIARRIGENKDIDGFERECSDEIAKRSGRDPRGIFVPMDIGWPNRGRLGIERFTRDLTVGSVTAGGNLVGTDHLGGEYIHALRARTPVFDLGARLLQNLRGDVSIPAANAETAFQWIAENDEPTEGAPTFRQVTMSPKTVAGFVDMSRKLTLQSDPSIEALIRQDLIDGAAVKINQAAIVAGATNEPTGVLGQSGIGSVAIGTNGDAIDWDTVVDLVKEVEVDDADFGSLAYMTNPKVVAAMRKTPRQSSGVEGNFILGESNTLLGYPVSSSTSVPSDGTKGGGSNLSSMIFGNWADLIIGMWSGLDLTVDPYSQSSKGIVRLVAFQDIDIAVRHAESFAAVTDIVAS